MVEQELIDLLIKRTAKHANQNKHKYIQEVAIWISKVFLSETKKNITFAYDRSWDTSGKIYKMEYPFCIDDYTTLDSFIEIKYNGFSEPSFISGMGMFHNYCSNELDDLTNEWISLQLKETID